VLSQLKLKSMRFACLMILLLQGQESLVETSALARMLKHIQSEQEGIMHVIPPPVGNVA
jgi:hypothetical protein